MGICKHCMFLKWQMCQISCEVTLWGINDNHFMIIFCDWDFGAYLKIAFNSNAWENYQFNSPIVEKWLHSTRTMNTWKKSNFKHCGRDTYMIVVPKQRTINVVMLNILSNPSSLTHPLLIWTLGAFFSFEKNKISMPMIVPTLERG